MFQSDDKGPGMFLNLVILSGFISISLSCSFLKTVPARNFELLSGESTGTHLSKVEIENQLGLVEKLAFNDFEVKIFPLISTYIQRFKSKDELLVDLPLARDQTCFFVEMTSHSSNKKSSYFNSWKGKALNFKNDSFDMAWTSKSLESVPSFSMVPSFHGPKKKFYNRGVLCASGKLDMTQYFQVKLAPQIMQWPLKADAYFKWRVAKKIIENGEVKYIRRKKKIIRYRGW